MAVTAYWYGKGVEGLFTADANRRIDWSQPGDTIKVALLGNTYTPAQDTHDFFNDVQGAEITGTGYSGGGVTLANKVATYDGATNTLRLDADDAEWLNATFSAAYAVVYKSTGNASTSPLLGLVDFGEVRSVTADTFRVRWGTDGVLRGVV